MGEERKVYNVMVGKSEGRRLLRRARRRWEDGIRMDLREIGLEGVDWIRLAQERDRWRAVVSAVMNLWVLAPRS
jgi:CRISPR/Cas system-associated protein Cas7 (RAMP superfamily)